MAHVFISYSKKDHAYAYRLADMLRAEGFDVWIDRRSLQPSQNWWREIVRGIRVCDALIPILTPQSDASEWVQREIALGLKWNKPMFPLLLDGDLESDNWSVFVLTQYEDVRSRELPPPNFFDQLARAAKRQKKPGADVTSQAPLVQVDEDDDTRREIAHPPPREDMIQTLPAPPNRDLREPIIGTLERVATDTQEHSAARQRRLYGLIALGVFLLALFGLVRSLPSLLKQEAVAVTFTPSETFVKGTLAFYTFTPESTVTSEIVAPTIDLSKPLATHDPDATVSLVDASATLAPITVFGVSADTATPVPTCRYVVMKGDTAYQIAKDHGLTTAELQAANQGVMLNMLVIGEWLNLPNCTPTPVYQATLPTNTATPY